MKDKLISADRFGQYIELRIHGWGSTGKGDRTQLLSRKEARLLAYRILIEAEDLELPAQRAA
jgi:hypothetical protein